MTKKFLIDRILEHEPAYDINELQESTVEELKDILSELTGTSSMYPNGYDPDAEDEDF